MMEDKFLELKKKLDETLTYPAVYMFKFILEADDRKIALIENLFTEEAEIYTKESDKGKYISITVNAVMISTVEIIDIYRRASAMGGVMNL